MVVVSKKRKIQFNILILIFILIPFSLSSCLLYVLTYGKYKFLHQSEPYEQMTVQIVEISEFYHSLGTVNADELENAITVIATIDDKESFMSDFKKIGHNYPLGDPIFGISLGKAVLLTYSDGSRELIARIGCALIETETAKIEYHGWFLEDDYNEFIEKWLSDK